LIITYGSQALTQKAWGRLEQALAFFKKQPIILDHLVGDHRNRCQISINDYLITNRDLTPNILSEPASGTLRDAPISLAEKTEPPNTTEGKTKNTNPTIRIFR
jgi:hypothetical protein